MTTIGPFSCFGLLYDDLVESLGEGTQILTVALNVNISCSCFLGVITNFVLTKFTCRKVGVVGSIFFFVGSVICAFTNSTFTLIFAFGVIQGIGLGLMVPASFTTFNYYFVRRRTFAMGITQLIIGIGGMILPLFIHSILEEYGFRGTQAIIAAIGLHSLFSAVVQQPVKVHLKRRKPELVLLEKCDSEDYTNGQGSFNFEVKGINHESDLQNQVQRLETFERISCHKSNSSRNERILTVRSSTENPEDSEKLDTPKEFHALETIGKIYQGISPQSEDHISTENVNQIVITDTGVNVSSKIFVVDLEESQIESDKDESKDDDSVAQQLLRDDYLTVCYTPNHTSTDLGSFTTGNPVSISDSKASVVSLGSWTSSFERGRHKYNEVFELKSNETSATPNIFTKYWSTVVDFMDLRLLLDPVYVNIAIGTSIALFCDITYGMLFPLVILDLGYTKADSALCISILAAADIGGRVCISFIGAFCPQISSRTLVTVGSTTSVIGRIIFVSLKDFTALATIIAFGGFCRSFVHVPLQLVIAEYDVKRFPAAYGLSMVIGGIIGIVLGSFIGWVGDVTNSYPICINTLNAVQFLTCILPWVLEFIICHFRSRSTTKET